MLILLMDIRVRVKPNAGVAKVKQNEDCLVVYVNAPAVRGKANRRLIEILSEFYGCPTKSIGIIRGEKSRDKLVRIVMGGRI